MKNFSDTVRTNDSESQRLYWCVSIRAMDDKISSILYYIENKKISTDGADGLSSIVRNELISDLKNLQNWNQDPNARRILYGNEINDRAYDDYQKLVDITIEKSLGILIGFHSDINVNFDLKERLILLRNENKEIENIFKKAASDKYARSNY